jgi:gamma-glutamyltranspeptidase/glutathione hydrolase
VAPLEAGGRALGLSLDVPGGEIPVLVATGEGPGQSTGRSARLPGQGIAPARTIAAVLPFGSDPVSGAGVPAATVPGAGCARLMFLRDHGSQPWNAVLRTASSTPRPVTFLPRVIATVGSVFAHFRTWPPSAAPWLSSDGVPPDAGRPFRTTVPASTHRRLLLQRANPPGRPGSMRHRLTADGSGAEAIDSPEAGAAVPSPTGRVDAHEGRTGFQEPACSSR